MKKMIMAALLVFAAAAAVQAQTSSDAVSARIAQKMKDSLSLNESQKQQIYMFNQQLAQQKLAVRQHFSAPDSVRIYTQRVENTRDSLYHRALPDETFQLYLQKKRNLVNNN